MSPDLLWLVYTCVLTGIIWVPYVLARIVRHGPWAAFGTPDHATRPDPAWAERARAAHANAAENLVVFAPLVIIAVMVGATSPNTLMAAKAYFFARLVHVLAYSLAIPVVRTLAFVAGFVATAVYAVAILQHMAA
ncbi:MAPEG family protein [Luteibacter yeojuensis]|uniref:Membrane protein n=1 Tax=Luteibacter yeojuensis TaxID=345309 RepID=A0A0F3KYT0_9GAMM|nr:MAPEG family protein [Luteibacter yeojuensis]KJV36378.1 membrane protein [Luteibacter yeojuensis]